VTDVSGGGILDTSTVLLLGRITDPGLLPLERLIPAVTLAELSVGPLVSDDPAERAGCQARLQQAEADFDPLPFDAAAARAFGRVAASLRSAGRNVNARTFDAMIAASAVAAELLLYTVNPEDFQRIDDLDLRGRPWSVTGTQLPLQRLRRPWSGSPCRCREQAPWSGGWRSGNDCAVTVVQNVPAQ
jgi:tRNA(fMet)-specific endonuclease VapC